MSVVALGLVKALGLNKFVEWKESSACSWNDTQCTFYGTVHLSFHIAGQRFAHKFLVAKRLATRTSAILGKDFLMKSKAKIVYDTESVKVTMGKKEIPLKRSSSKIISVAYLNKEKESTKLKCIKQTFGAEKKTTVKTQARSCEGKKVEPVFGSVIRVCLDPLPFESGQNTHTSTAGSQYQA